MELNLEIYKKMVSIDWFKACGLQYVTGLPFQVQQVSDVLTAIANALASNWRDAGTAAQGELTGYLAQHHYDAYGGYWNRLAQASRERVKKEIMPTVDKALKEMGGEVLSDVVLLDLNRIAIQTAYSKRYRRVPDFFQRLLAVYEQGRLPCGWIGDLDMWPEGMLIIY